MRIFLIAGKAGSGKNEVANLIKNKMPNSVITGFSKYIKLFALELSNWDGKDFDKPREFLQNMGDTLRSIDEDFMTNRLKEDLDVYARAGKKNIIISDVRLIHELEYFKKLTNYEVIAIRVNATTSKRNLTQNEQNHHTELELDNYPNFDYIINNSFDENLIKDVNNIIEGMK